MLDPSTNPLPHGAKGIDLGEAVLIFANDKLIMQAKTAQHHVAIHFGTRSKVLDIHEKRTAADGTVTYATLFTIPHANLAAMLQEIAVPTTRALMGVLRSLRPGWMAKRRIGVAVGLVPTESEIPLVTKLRHRKLVLDPEKLAAQMWVPEFLDDLYDLPDGHAFTVFSCKDPDKQIMIGIGFKYTEPTGRRRLVWLSNRRVGDMLEGSSALLRGVAEKFGTFHRPLPWL